MATWTTPKQTWVGDDVVAASNMNDIGGDLQFLYDWTGALGYAEVTANQTGITTETDLTSLSVTVTVPSGGRRIKITGYVQAHSTVTSDIYRLRIKESTTVLQDCQFGPQGSTSFNATGVCMGVFTPSSGSHTYKLSLARDAGTGTVNLAASSTNPCYILVEGL